jgi:Ran GTPase-activating protein (RanGAP) involved in mRNA processing and transport
MKKNIELKNLNSPNFSTRDTTIDLNDINSQLRDALTALETSHCELDCSRSKKYKIFKFLSFCTSLQSLKISQKALSYLIDKNELEALGITIFEFVCISLIENKTLKSLNFDNIYIGKEGSKLLAKALKHNTTLQSLSLERNSIGNEGAIKLADALKHNTTLHSLYLELNYVENEGKKAFLEALKVNTSLRSLKLTFMNDTTYENDIKALLDRNNTSKIKLFNQLKNLYKKCELDYGILEQKLCDITGCKDFGGSLDKLVSSKEVSNKFYKDAILTFFLETKSDIFASLGKPGGSVIDLGQLFKINLESYSPKAPVKKEEQKSYDQYCAPKDPGDFNYNIEVAGTVFDCCIPGG